MQLFKVSCVMGNQQKNDTQEMHRSYSDQDLWNKDSFLCLIDTQNKTFNWQLRIVKHELADLFSPFFFKKKNPISEGFNFHEFEHRKHVDFLSCILMLHVDFLSCIYYGRSQTYVLRRIFTGSVGQV